MYAINLYCGMPRKGRVVGRFGILSWWWFHLRTEDRNACEVANKLTMFLKQAVGNLNKFWGLGSIKVLYI